MSVQAELTAQEAAVNVSGSYLIPLLESGELPHYKTGTHHHMQARDVLTYKERTDAERRDALKELAEQAQELSLGYE